MSFKDIIKSDVKNTFFNTNEFAEKHLYGNREITAIVDDDNMIAKYSSEYEFLGKGSHMIMVPEEEFNKKPAVGSVITFDGCLYEVNEVKRDDGILVIFLNSNKG